MLTWLAYLAHIAIPNANPDNPLVANRYEALVAGHEHLRAGQLELARAHYWNAIMGGLVEDGFEGYELAWAAEGAQYMAHLDMARAFHLQALQEVEQEGRDWAEGDMNEAERHLVAAAMLNPDSNELSRLRDLVVEARPGGKLVIPEMQLSESFGAVWSFDLWGDGGAGARSGPGSSPHSTQLISSLLVHVALKHNVSSMLDAACGGMAWMPSVLHSIERLRMIKGIGDGVPDVLFRYTCVDVVPDLIKSLQEKFGTEPGWSFVNADLAMPGVVLDAYDLILARDFLFHLSTRRVIAVLEAFRKSGSRFLVLTHNPHSHSNLDRAIWHAGAPVQHGAKPLPIGFTGGLDQGGYRPVNLHLPPYNFPAPLWEVVDEPVGGSSPGEAPQRHAMTRVVAMWSLSMLKIRL